MPDRTETQPHLEIIPARPARPAASRQASSLEKGTSEFLDHCGYKRDASALYDADLMAGERVEAVRRRPSGTPEPWLTRSCPPLWSF